MSPIDRLPRRRPWTAWEIAFLTQEYGGSLVADIARAMNRGIDAVRAKVIALQLPRVRTRWTPELDEVLALTFPDASARAVGELIGCTAAAVRVRAAQLGVRKAPGFAAEHSRRTTLARSPFTPEIAEVIGLLYPDTLTQDIADLVGMPLDRVHAYATKKGWHKTPEFTSETARARTGPDHPMRRHQFPKGHVPANKGVKGISYPGMEATQFKKGTRSHTWKPIGSLRINADGYLDRKVNDTGYPPRDWLAVHRLVWIEANGPIPAGHVVRFKDGKRSTRVEDITADVLECHHAGRERPAQQLPQQLPARGGEADRNQGPHATNDQQAPARFRGKNMSTEPNYDDNHVSTVRKILLDQMRALRSATPDEVERELGRAKGVAELAQAVVNTAKVEVDYVKATGQGRTPFLEPAPATPVLTDETSTHDKLTLPAPNGITSVVQHRLKG